MAQILCKVYCAKCGKLLGTRTLSYSHACPSIVAKSSSAQGAATLVSPLVDASDGLSLLFNQT